MAGLDWLALHQVAKVLLLGSEAVRQEWLELAAAAAIRGCEVRQSRPRAQSCLVLAEQRLSRLTWHPPRRWKGERQGGWCGLPAGKIGDCGLRGLQLRRTGSNLLAKGGCLGLRLLQLCLQRLVLGVQAGGSGTSFGEANFQWLLLLRLLEVVVQL